LSALGLYSKEVVMRRKDLLACLPPLTPQQWNVINGSLLGDATVTNFRSDRNSYLFKPQEIKKTEYVRWHFDVLRPYNGSIRPYTSNPTIIRKTGRVVKGSKHMIFSTVAHPVFTDMRKKWYPDASDRTPLHKKRVPRDIRLNAQTLAVWFADDGTGISRNKYAAFCTQRFPEPDVDFLILELEQLGLRARKVKDRQCDKPQCGFRIRLLAESYKDFIDLIAPFFVWKCLAYKIDLTGYSDLPTNNSTGLVGVVWDRNRQKWRAEIKVEGRKVHLGRFDTVEEAIKARQEAEVGYGWIGCGNRSRKMTLPK
jgi:hypothetical protein